MDIAIQRLDSTRADFPGQLASLTGGQDVLDGDVNAVVEAIVSDVAARGDAAVLEYTARFDGLQAATVAELEIPRERLRRALNTIDPVQRDALERAAERVRSYHQHQKQESWQYRDAGGNLLGQKVSPIERAGIYVPARSMGDTFWPSKLPPASRYCQLSCFWCW